MATDIILYYWDERDGVAFSGWWFGDSVGGRQVWAGHPSFAMTPPSPGLKVSWCGDTISGPLSVAPPRARSRAKPTPVTPVGRWRKGDRIVVQFVGIDHWHERVLLQKAASPTDWVILTPDLAVCEESYAASRTCTRSGDIKDFALMQGQDPPPRLQGEHINRFQQDISLTDIQGILEVYRFQQDISRTDIQGILGEFAEAPRSSAS